MCYVSNYELFMFSLEDYVIIIMLLTYLYLL